VTCNQIIGGDVPRQYILGRLNDEERQQYELHYFSCKSCFRDLQVLSALRDILIQNPAALPAARRRWPEVWISWLRSSVTLPRCAAGAAALAIAGGAVWNMRLLKQRQEARSAAVEAMERVRELEQLAERLRVERHGKDGIGLSDI
jgi:hypothetical protein